MSVLISVNVIEMTIIKALKKFLIFLIVYESFGTKKNVDKEKIISVLSAIYIITISLLGFSCQQLMLQFFVVNA